MSTTKVILSKPYPALGFVGSVLTVKRGYARNFLIPRGIAVEASSRNAKQLEHQMQLINAHKAKAKTEAERIQETLAGTVLNFKLKASDTGKFYGSIMARDIERGLKEKGFDIVKKQILLGDPIKTEGEHTVEIRLHQDVTVPIKLDVQREKLKIKEQTEDEDTKTKAKADKEASDLDESEEIEASAASASQEEVLAEESSD